ncbi:hypothetical protein [Bacillus taeanensis]|uniref:Uncharacterized protein n=1 Tax=Bacillus taeanensis TaxID=273032 RepID=A0A366XU12_9BACI|nr:hypothetical protein [Bacillus taeanensis]RBW69850.1 hypothetical protein DS031_10005 [Bacillus taeanensis]
MQPLRKTLFIVGNIVIGIFSFYLYMFFWLTVQFGEGASIHPWLSIPLDLLLFAIFNGIVLRRQKKQYWLYSILIAGGTSLLLTLIIGLT